MIKLNPDLKVNFLRIGDEEQPLLIIDDLVSNPDELVEIASNSNWMQPESTYYPGINAQLPHSYSKVIIDGLRDQIARAFNIPKTQKLLVSGFWGLTTFPLEKFDPWQKIPHYDRAEIDHLAMVHYMNKEIKGGTGFFRHIPTGYESISPNRVQEYRDYVTHWIDEKGASQLVDFAGEKTPDFELFYSVPFKYNRIAIYPSYVLHCALYSGIDIDENPRTGRLTANNFIIPTL